MTSTTSGRESTYSIPGIQRPSGLYAAVLGSLDGRQAGTRNAKHLDFRQRIRIPAPRSGRTDPVELTVTMMAYGMRASKGTGISAVFLDLIN